MLSKYTGSYKQDIGFFFPQIFQREKTNKKNKAKQDKNSLLIFLFLFLTPGLNRGDTEGCFPSQHKDEA